MPWGIAASVVAAGIGAAATNKASKRAASSADKALEANAYQGEIAMDQFEDYKTFARPVEHSVYADAMNTDTPEAYDKAAGDAQASVSSQLGMARDRMARTPGVDPSSAAAQAATTSMELKGAAMGAAAANKARDGIKDKAFARKLNAVGIGKGLVSNASSGLASAAATASSIAGQQSAQASQTAAGMGNMVSGITNGLSKINWGGSGTSDYSKWESNNAGVMQSTGLSSSELAGAF
ncbi:hypothetical protein LXA47_32500 [Massilia sp. P8910]|uniref:hypothetical protein n=1 Tax=Massilia antarctica TaxID=2765360 RepID=UPI001E3AE01D|nr:hypothetical protein [Massilia antarctica]MCE3608291.1 hypothetical protein [Massilia antarctica]